MANFSFFGVHRRSAFRSIPVAGAFSLFLSAGLSWSQDDKEAESTPTATPEGHSLHGEVFNEGPRQAAVLIEGTGNIDFPVGTKNEEAQKFFNQGVGQLHGFWFLEAERSFRQVAKLDPDCAMAYWGMAMANVENEKRAKDFLKEANKLKDKASEKDKMWLEVLSKKFDEKEKDKTKRFKSTVKALEAIIYKYPDEIEARAFLVVEFWRTRKISSHVAVNALANEVLAKNPLHPVHHYRIHLWDYEKAERALNSSAKCGTAAPGIAHMWHMPGHIYSKLKRYSDAAWQQEASARVDHAHMIRYRIMPDEIHNYAHNNEWCASNLSKLGRVEDSITLSKNLVELPRLPKFLKKTATSKEEKEDAKEEKEDAKEKKEDAKEKKEDAKEKKEDAKENKEDAKEKKEDAKEKKEDAKDKKEDAKENKEDAKDKKEDAKEKKDEAEDEKKKQPADPGFTFDERGRSAYKQGRRRLIEISLEFELFDELIAMEKNGAYLLPDSDPGREATRRRALVVALARTGDLAGARKMAEPIQAELEEQEAKKKSAEEAAEKKARDEKKNDKEIASAKKKAGEAFNRKITRAKNALAELELIAALKDGDLEKAEGKMDESKDIPRLRRASYWSVLKKHDKAIEEAREAVKRAPSEVLPYAILVDVLLAADKKEDAIKEFTTLRKVGGHSDLDLPVFKRIETFIAEQVGENTEWRQPDPRPEDFGERPDIASLGPFRWQPPVAPHFSLSDGEGKMHSLSDYQGRPVLLVHYLGHQCEHCMQQLNALAPLAEKFKDAGIEIVAIATDDKPGLLETFATVEGDSKKRFPFPLLADPNLQSFKAYRAYDDFEEMALHGTYLIDGQGRIRWQDISYQPFEQMEFLLEESKRLLKLEADGGQVPKTAAR